MITQIPEGRDVLRNRPPGQARPPKASALGTDGKEIKVRYSYVDWIIPQTDVKVLGASPTSAGLTGL